MSNKPAYGTPLDAADNTLTPRLRAYWPCNDGAGAVLHDATGNGNHFSLYKGNAGTIDPNPGWVSGPHGSALSFDGTTQWGFLAENTSIEPSAAITVAMLVNVTAQANSSINVGIADLLRKSNPAPANGFILRWQAFGNSLIAELPAYVTDTVPNAALIGSPHLISMTYDSATGNTCLYVDKTLRAFGNNSSKPAITHSDPLTLLCSYYYNGTFSPANPPPLNLPAILDMALIADKAFTPCDISALVDNPFMFYDPYPAVPSAPQGQETSLPAIGADVPSVIHAGQNTWDVLYLGAVIATSDAPGGWQVGFDGQMIYVIPPAGTVLDTCYEVRYQSA